MPTKALAKRCLLFPPSKLLPLIKYYFFLFPTTFRSWKLWENNDHFSKNSVPFLKAKNWKLLLLVHTLHDTFSSVPLLTYNYSDLTDDCCQSYSFCLFLHSSLLHYTHISIQHYYVLIQRWTTEIVIPFLLGSLSESAHHRTGWTSVQKSRSSLMKGNLASKYILLLNWPSKVQNHTPLNIKQHQRTSAIS